MKRISLLLLAATILLTPSCDFMKSINPFGKKTREAEAFRQQQRAIHIADSIRAAGEREAEAQRIIRDEMARKTEEEARNISGYHVIVGSFLTPSFADSWLEHIKTFGFDVQLVGMDGGRWHLVSAGAFPDFRAARSALEGIAERIDGEAWIYRNE